MGSNIFFPSFQLVWNCLSCFSKNSLPIRNTVPLQDKLGMLLHELESFIKKEERDENLSEDVMEWGVLACCVTLVSSAGSQGLMDDLTITLSLPILPASQEEANDRCCSLVKVTGTAILHPTRG